jgi:hypothetical protein
VLQDTDIAASGLGDTEPGNNLRPIFLRRALKRGGERRGSIEPVQATCKPRSQERLLPALQENPLSACGKSRERRRPGGISAGEDAGAPSVLVELRQAEVEQLYRALIRDHDICRLHMWLMLMSEEKIPGLA